MRQDHAKGRLQKSISDGDRDYERKRKNGVSRSKMRFKAIMRRIQNFLKRNSEHKQMLCVMIA